MRWYLRIPLLTSVFVLLWFLGVHGSQRIVPRIDVEMSLTFSPEEPELDEEFTVTLTFTPREEIPHSNELDDAAAIYFDPGVELVGGVAWWEGRWVKGKTETFQVVVKVTEPEYYTFVGMVYSCRSDPRIGRKLLGIRPEMAEISEKIFRFHNSIHHTLCIGKPELHTGEEIWSIDGSTGEAKRIRVDVPPVPPSLIPEKAVVRDAEKPWNGINAEAQTQEETATGDKYVPDDLRNKIAFVCSDGICTINSDGTDLKLIVPSDSGGPFSDVRWSPDKRRIGFTGHVDGQARVMLVESDGSNRRIFHLPEAGTPDSRAQKRRKVALGPYRLSFSDWSPEGQRLSTCLFGGLDDTGTILIMDTKGKELFRTVLGYYARFCGKNEIIFAASTSPFSSRENDIISLDFASGTKKNLTNDRKHTYFPPAVSPDGKRVAYTFDPVSGGSGELWIMDVNGSNKKRLAGRDSGFLGRHLPIISFSPDGSKILFLAVKIREEIGALHTIDVDGANLRKITDDIVKSRGGASWSPDAKQIVFTSRKDGNDELYIVMVDGSHLTCLTSNSAPDCCPDW